MDTERDMADWLAHIMVAKKSSLSAEAGKKQTSEEQALNSGNCDSTGEDHSSKGSTVLVK